MGIFIFSFISSFIFILTFYLTFCEGRTGKREAGCAGVPPPEDNCRVKGRRKGRSSFEVHVERYKRSKREERKERRKREKSEERRFLSEYRFSFDALVERGVSRLLSEVFKEQYSLCASREYYPVKIPRPSRCNPFKEAALKAYEDFLAKRDIGVSYTGNALRFPCVMESEGIRGNKN